jgi:hypothetical protein
MRAISRSGERGEALEIGGRLAIVVNNYYITSEPTAQWGQKQGGPGQKTACRNMSAKKRPLSGRFFETISRKAISEAVW